MRYSVFGKGLVKNELFGDLPIKAGTDSKGNVKLHDAVEKFIQMNEVSNVQFYSHPGRFTRSNAYQPNQVLTSSEASSMFKMLQNGGQERERALNYLIGFNPVRFNPYAFDEKNNNVIEVEKLVGECLLRLSNYAKTLKFPLKVDKRTNLLFIDEERCLEELVSIYENIHVKLVDKENVNSKTNEQSFLKAKERLDYYHNNYSDLSFLIVNFDSLKKTSMQLNLQTAGYLQLIKAKYTKDKEMAFVVNEKFEEWLSALTKQQRFKTLFAKYSNERNVERNTNAAWDEYQSSPIEEGISEIKVSMIKRRSGIFHKFVPGSYDESSIRYKAIMNGIAKDEVVRKYKEALLLVWRTRNASKTASLTAMVDNIPKILDFGDDYNAMRSAYAVSIWTQLNLGEIMPFLNAMKYSPPGRSIDLEQFGPMLKEFIRCDRSGSKGTKLFTLDMDIKQFDLNFALDFNWLINKSISKYFKNGEYIRWFLDDLRQKPMVIQSPYNQYDVKDGQLMFFNTPGTMVPSGSYKTPVDNFCGTTIPAIAANCDFYGLTPTEFLEAQMRAAEQKKPYCELNFGDNLMLVGNDLSELAYRRKHMAKFLLGAGLEATGSLNGFFLKKEVHDGSQRNIESRVLIQNTFYPEDVPQGGILNALALITKYERLGYYNVNDIYGTGDTLGDVSSFRKEFTVFLIAKVRQLLSQAAVPNPLVLAYLDELVKWKSGSISKLKKIRQKIELDASSWLLTKLAKNLDLKDIDAYLQNFFSTLEDNSMKFGDPALLSLLYTISKNKHSPSGMAMYAAYSQTEIGKLLQTLEASKKQLAIELRELAGINPDWYQIK